MARYVDGYVLPIPRTQLQVYRRMAQKAGKIWREHGALDYKECAGDDLNIKMGVPFPRQMKIKSGETVVFAYILFKSRTHRDRVNAKVMKDPRIAGMGESAVEQLVAQFVQTVDATCAQRQVTSLGGERPGHPRAQTRTRAGDQDPLSCLLGRHLGQVTPATYFSNFDIRRSVRILPPVWQVAQ